MLKFCLYFSATDISTIDLTIYEPNVIASVLKKFLRELPDPVIPVQWYDRFLEASSMFIFYIVFVVHKLVLWLPELSSL